MVQITAGKTDLCINAFFWCVSIIETSALSELETSLIPCANSHYSKALAFSYFLPLA